MAKKKHRALTETKLRILGHLASNKYDSARNIASVVGDSAIRVNQMLNELWDLGYVKQQATLRTELSADGVRPTTAWEISATGKKYIKDFHKTLFAKNRKAA